VTEDEARQAAMDLARRDGRDIDAYEQPTVDREQDRWIVFFQGRSLAPGDHFMVVLDADTGAGRVVAGR
jgi:hypothetical protein